MISTSMVRVYRFSRVAAVAAVMGLGAAGPAMALDMICSNVSSMETDISNTLCCSDDPWSWVGCLIAGGDTQCALSSGPLQACCDDPSDTAGEQTACLCGQVSGYSDYALGFTPEGC